MLMGWSSVQMEGKFSNTSLTVQKLTAVPSHTKPCHMTPVFRRRSPRGTYTQAQWSLVFSCQAPQCIHSCSYVSYVTAVLELFVLRAPVNEVATDRHWHGWLEKSGALYNTTANQRNFLNGRSQSESRFSVCGDTAWPPSTSASMTSTIFAAQSWSKLDKTSPLTATTGNKIDQHKCFGIC